VWAIDEATTFAQRLQRVVFASDDFHAMARCVHVALLYAKLVEEKGLALRWKLWKLFAEDLLAALQTHAQRCSPSLMITRVLEL